MFKSIYDIWVRKFGLSKKQGQHTQAYDQVITPEILDKAIIEGTVTSIPQENTVKQRSNMHVPYDECLLEKAWTQWQFGEWESLAKLEHHNIQHHPDRAKLALLAAAGRLQIGQTHAARHYIRLAKDWNCDLKLISQILISGIYNTLARSAVITNDKVAAINHFEASMKYSPMGGDRNLLTQARAHAQVQQIKSQRSDIENLQLEKVLDFSGVALKSDDIIESLASKYKLDVEFRIIELESKKTNLLKKREFARNIILSWGGSNNNQWPLVSIIVATARPDNILNIIKNISCQRYVNKELIVIPQNYTQIQLSVLQKALNGIAKDLMSFKVLSLGDKLALGTRLNHGIRSANGSYWAKMDDDDIYLENYLSDLMMELVLNDYDIVGKSEQFVYCEGINKTILKRPGYSNLKTSVSGASLVVKRDARKEVLFGDVNKGEDTFLLKAARDDGLTIYAADPFNFVVMRSSSPDKHTWKASDEYFLNNGEVICEGLDLNIVRA